MDSYQIKIKALAHGGACVGDIVSGPMTGKKAFVREVVPGELITASTLKDESHFVFAELKELLEPSPFRRKAPCPKFGICGGCDLQHMRIDSQRDAKRQMVESMLLQQAKIRPTLGVRLMGTELPEFYYRRRINLHLDKSGQIGFFRHASGEVVDISHCHLASTEINQALEETRPVISQLKDLVSGVIIENYSGQVFIGLALREDIDKSPQATVKEIQALAGMNLKNLIIRHNEKIIFASKDGNPLPEGTQVTTVGHFSQVNEEANDILVNSVKELVETEQVTDLYAGAGNLSFPLALAGKSVDAVEVDEKLVTQGQILVNEKNLSKKIRFYNLSTEKFLRSYKLKESVVLDPPRSGAKQIVRIFDPKITRRIVYVSCALPTLTRDLKTLVERGYTVKDVRVLDMFPQTHHVETLTVLDAI